MFGTGDFPAISKLLGLKGHNAKCHCRYCLIEGISKGFGNGSAQYFPLQFPNHRPLYSNHGPGTLEKKARSEMHYNVEDVMNPESHLARTFQNMKDSYLLLKQMKADSNISAAEVEYYSKSTGINGQTILTQLPTMIYPQCFPLDVMHLIFLNVFKRMYSHWSGSFFKTNIGIRDEQPKQDYEIPESTWINIGKEMESNRNSLPLSFGSYTRDIYKYWRGYKAEEWKNWMIRLSIPLLNGHLPQKYLKPWSKFINALKRLLDFTPKTQEDLDKIDMQFREFYLHYERYTKFLIYWFSNIFYKREYYQYENSRISCCLSVFHGLLHVIRSVRDCGPPSVFWQYPMERFCGICLPYIKSKRNPYLNLVNNISRRRKLDLIQHIPFFSNSHLTFPSIKSNAENFSVTLDFVCLTLLSAKSSNMKPIPIKDRRILIQYYIFQSIIKRNSIFLKRDLILMERQIKEVRLDEVYCKT